MGKGASLKVYLAGKMSGLSWDEMQQWRREFSQHVNEHTYNCNMQNKVRIFNPCDYYNPLLSKDDDDGFIDREAMQFDIYHLKDSDIVVANLDGDSIGTAMEVAIAKDNGIPVIGICHDKSTLHPWLKESCMALCNSLYDAEAYVCDYLILPMMA